MQRYLGAVPPFNSTNFKNPNSLGNTDSVVSWTEGAKLALKTTRVAVNFEARQQQFCLVYKAATYAILAVFRQAVRLSMTLVPIQYGGALAIQVCANAARVSSPGSSYGACRAWSYRTRY
jgi:predicted secreted protein